MEKGTVAVRPYELNLDYNHWTYGKIPCFLPCDPVTNLLIYIADILSSIVPEEELEDFPVAFSQVGHVGRFCICV